MQSIRAKWKSFLERLLLSDPAYNFGKSSRELWLDCTERNLQQEVAYLRNPAVNNEEKLTAKSEKMNTVRYKSGRQDQQKLELAQKTGAKS